MRNSKQSGQVIILLLVILLVGLTLALSITSRTLQQMKVTTVSEHSSRAFTAAEAAIEEALRQDLEEKAGAGWQELSSGSLGGKIEEAKYEVEKASEFSLTVQKDDVVQVDLENFSGNLDVYWVKKSDPEENQDDSRASLELIFIKEVGGDYSVIRFAVNSEIRDNGFTNPGETDTNAGVTLANTDNGNCSSDLDGKGYCNKVTISGLSGIQVLRIKPFYNKATILVTNVPPQIYTIKGEATTVADVTRRVEVKKAPPALPPIFDYVIFDGSGNALRK